MELYKKVDLVLLFSVVGLIAMGLVALYSSSHTAMVSGETTNYFLKQLIWVSLGVSALVVVYFMPHRWFFDFAYPLYGVGLFMLVLVLLFGFTGMGAERWIRLGPFKIQPSEFAKLTTILALAKYISSEKIDLNSLHHFLIATLIPFVPFLLIVRQPDLGTSLVFVALTLPMFYWAGLKGTNLVLIVFPVLILFASFHFYAFLILMLVLIIYLVLTNRSLQIIVINFLGNVFMGMITPVLWNQLKPYQQNRIKIFLRPEADPRGAGYQIIQSKVAIGSGGLFGKGFMQGSQTQLRFLPEQHTDFIFAVIGEEFGLMGVTLGLLFFFILLVRGIQIAAMVKNRFNSIVSIGIVTVFAFQIVINIGMTVGLFPVTGIPLPFLSYGGSSLITNMVMIGLLLNFYRNRYEY